MLAGLPEGPHPGRAGQAGGWAAGPVPITAHGAAGASAWPGQGAGTQGQAVQVGVYTLEAAFCLYLKAVTVHVSAALPAAVSQVGCVFALPFG